MGALKILLVLCLAVGGCLSAFHREDVDDYDGASATVQGNGRQTTMATSQPDAQRAAPIPPLIPIRQVDPSVGQVFNLRLNGKVYEAMKKTDGKVYILQEVK